MDWGKQRLRFSLGKRIGDIVSLKLYQSIQCVKILKTPGVQLFRKYRINLYLQPLNQSTNQPINYICTIELFSGIGFGGDPIRARVTANFITVVKIAHSGSVQHLLIQNMVYTLIYRCF